MTLAVLAIGIAYSLGIILKLDPLNGIPQLSHWEWPWRSFGNLRTAALLFGPLPLIAWVAWKAEEKISRAGTAALLALLAVANYGLQLLGVLVDPRGYPYFVRIVTSPRATSYYTDALAIQDVATWLGSFHLQHLHSHAATHPPAPILFYYVFIKLFGPAQGALLGGCAVGLLGSIGVPVVYHFAGLWRHDRRFQLTAAAFYALVPALVVFFPEFDQIYPIFLMLLLICWAKALEGSARHALYLGVVLFVSTFFAHNLLTAGVLLGFYTIDWSWRERWERLALRRLAICSAVALAVWAGIYGVLWVTTGYDPIASLHSALASQAVSNRELQRSHLWCSIYDPYDFALGAGVMPVAIVFIYLWRNLRDLDVKLTDVALTVIGLATILVIDVSGVLRAETARVWLFCQPLITVPAALEIGRLGRPQRLALFAVQWWILVCIKANMAFIQA